MSIEKFTMGDLDLKMGKISLKDANTLYPIVSNGIIKLVIGGDLDFLGNLKEKDFESLQTIICKNTTHTSTGSNLTLCDLDSNVDCFIPLLILFLNFNFGFFSEAPKVIRKVLCSGPEEDQ